MASLDSPTLYKALASCYQHFFLTSDVVHPFVLPYHLYGATALFIYLLIPHTRRPWLHAARWPLNFVICGFQLHLLFVSRSLDPAMGIMAGMMAIYGMMLSSTWLWWNEPQFEAKRIQIRYGKENRNIEKEEGSDKGSASGVEPVQEIRQRECVKDEQNSNEDPVQHRSEEQEDDRVQYYWQSYPKDDFLQRLDWVVTLLTSRRGTRWNWRIATLPNLPASVTRTLPEANVSKPAPKSKTNQTATQTMESQTSFTGIRTFGTPTELLREIIPRILVSTVLLCCLMLAMKSDPHFMISPKVEVLPVYLRHLPAILLKSYRQLLPLLFLVIGMSDLAPSFIALIPILLNTLSPIIGRTIYTSTWLYPTSFGSPSLILKRGLNGFWGGFWHQEFRFAFSSPVMWLIKVLHLNPKSIPVKICGLLAAFIISGLLHLGMTTTKTGGTSGWGSFLFFIMQGAGVFLQTLFCTLFTGQIKSLPTWLRKVGNGVFVVLWLTWTADLMLDEFANVGLWSVLWNGVSLKNVEVGWYVGNWWWQSGLGIRML